LLIACLATTLAAQTDPDFDSPIAWKRAQAEASLSEPEQLALARKRLDEGASPPALIRALEVLKPKRDQADLPRVLKFIGELDPSVSEAAMEALRAHGPDGLKALRALDDRQVDRETRKRAVEQLLKDHLLACCRRDMSINPFRLDFKDRFAELYSVEENVESLIFKLLREARSDIRDDISGRRYYWYYNQRSQPFVDYGGLAVAAIARSNPKRLMDEFGEFANLEEDQDGYYWWGYYNQRTPVTMELAIFFARQGKPSLADRIINGIEGSQRGFNMGGQNQLNVQVAALQTTALGEHAAALERMNDSIKNLDADGPAATQAHYLRARLLMTLGEEGAALRALEDSMEASDYVMVMALVDDAFTPLETDRRFQTIRRYCELAVRRLDEGRRPWRPALAGE
jgi:hypothetical protein